MFIKTAFKKGIVGLFDEGKHRRKCIEIRKFLIDDFSLLQAREERENGEKRGRRRGDRSKGGEGREAEQMTVLPVGFVPRIMVLILKTLVPASRDNLGHFSEGYCIQ